MNTPAKNSVKRSGFRPALARSTQPKPITLHREINIVDGFMYREELVQFAGKAYSVPAGMRLAIVSVSGALDLPVGQSAFRVSFRSEKNGISNPQHWLLPMPVATNYTNADFYIIDEKQVRAFVEQGESIVLAVTRTGFTGQANIQVTLTAYLLDS